VIYRLGISYTPSVPKDLRRVLTDFFALNLVECDIWCHYHPSMDQDIKAFMKRHDMKKVIAIPKDAGLFVRDGVINVIGPNVITVFDGSGTRVVHSREILDWSVFCSNSDIL
jgi:peptidase E